MDIQAKLDEIKAKIKSQEEALTACKLNILVLKKQGREYQKLIDKAKELEK